ncbi:hypothetical protein JTB14_021058 [Gonioctena quinquepunctata]|nr:hypothetical protein JTB14_021058 [Gonioctena quinquepunctata]
MHGTGVKKCVPSDARRNGRPDGESSLSGVRAHCPAGPISGPTRGKHMNSITNKEGGDRPRKTGRTDSAGSTGAGRSDLTIAFTGGNQVQGKLNIGGKKQVILVRARINSMPLPTDKKMIHLWRWIPEILIRKVRVPRCLPLAISEQLEKLISENANTHKEIKEAVIKLRRNTNTFQRKLVQK